MKNPPYLWGGVSNLNIIYFLKKLKELYWIKNKNINSEYLTNRAKVKSFCMFCVFFCISNVYLS